MKSIAYTKKLKIVGGIETVAVTTGDIAALLQQGRQELGREGDFIGKSTTSLYVGDHYVLKLHTEQIFSDADIAYKWTDHHLKNEREAGVYHPQRCWFIKKHQALWVPGNITPRLQAVHTIFESLIEAEEEHLNLLTDITAMYLDYTARIDKRLDEGLSNFGLDGHKLYYLDDDIFKWDQFNAFSALTAGWIRRYSTSWLSATITKRFAKKLGQQLEHFFKNQEGMDASQVVAEQLHGMFFAAGEIQDAANILIEILRYGTSKHTPKEHDHFADLESFAEYFHEDEPIAVLADVHANLPALEVVLEEVRRRGITRIFVLGDLVGYGPHPEACIDLLCKVGAVSLQGNHDYAVATGNMVRSITSSSSWTADWSIKRLEKKHRSYLKHLPLRMIHRPWLAVHGAPIDKTFFNAYVYEPTAEANLHWMQKENYRFALHGHSHLQGVYALSHGQVICIKDQTTIDLDLYPVALICPGSVGQPRGGMIGATFAILKPLSGQLELLRLDYDVKEVIQDMIIEQFPEQLIRLLKTGMST
ncbi:MAG: metallophosphoesterase family protein [Mariprofundaceae bacterium]|nr:metallophosphoesterase family protein [Mariprofundaceae bacterium]